MRTRDAQFLVLHALADGPLHGYAVNTAIERRSGDRLGAGSLYGALTRLEGKQLIEPVGGRGRRRTMRLTPAGRAELERGLREMSQVFEAATPARVDYLDRTAASNAGRAYKPRMLDALALDPGCTVLDLGCGPGTDLPAMASAAGRVIGLDNDPAMLAAAGERTAGDDGIDVISADVHTLPFGDATVDRVRTDRVLQHVDDPARVLREAHRVLRPGGRLIMGEPDWHTLAVDHPSLDLAAAYTRFITEHVVRNAGIGRSLPRLAARAGFAVPDTAAVTPVFRDVRAADAILGFHRNTERAVAAGHFTPEDARTWLGHLAEGEFFASVTQFVIVATVT